jgi:peptidoglycan/LPS O-acetylase OafA/YrhL
MSPASQQHTTRIESEGIVNSLGTRTGSERQSPVLDGLRAISILLVLGGHLLPLGPKLLQLNATAATMGMSLFFALSGFLIATSLLHNSNVAEFAAKRIGRVLPLVFVYALFLLIFVKFDVPGFAFTIAFLLNYFPQYMFAYNEHLWSLCVEVQFYAAIGTAVLIGGKRFVWLVWPACLLVTFLRVTEGAYIHIQTHLRVDEILAGACVATLFHSLSPQRRMGAALWAAATLCWFASASPYGGWLQYTRPYATAILLMVTLCSCSAIVVKPLSSRVLKYIATTSYALYIFHPLTTYGWLHDGGPAIKYLVKRPISFLLTFACAHISTFYFERPILNAIKGAFRHKHQTRPNVA